MGLVVDGVAAVSATDCKLTGGGRSPSWVLPEREATGMGHVDHNIGMYNMCMCSDVPREDQPTSPALPQSL